MLIILSMASPHIHLHSAKKSPIVNPIEFINPLIENNTPVSQQRILLTKLKALKKGGKLYQNNKLLMEKIDLLSEISTMKKEKIKENKIIVINKLINNINSLLNNTFNSISKANYEYRTISLATRNIHEKIFELNTLIYVSNITHFKTPYLTYNTEKLKENIKQLKDSFKKNNIQITPGITYAIKKLTGLEHSHSIRNSIVGAFLFIITIPALSRLTKKKKESNNFDEKNNKLTPTKEESFTNQKIEDIQ